MAVRELQAGLVTDAVRRLCVESACVLGPDVLAAYREARAREESPLGRDILADIERNALLAAEQMMPACQDTGMAWVLLELGQDVHVAGGDLYQAVHEGVRRGYAEGHCRKSVLDLVTRVNTGDNTPAVVHTEIVPGDRLRILLMTKGFGAENFSRVGLFPPHVGWEGIKDFVVETVSLSGSSSCPPLVVGVGLGGTMDKAALMAKRELARPVGSPHPDPFLADLERDLLERINRLGIGPQGLGGTVTAMAVHVATYPTHIASLPVAVNLQCHSHRHKEAVL